jgi:hypothetical protein
VDARRRLTVPRLEKVDDKPEIDPATRQRVLRVAQSMGYRPSRLARGMVGPGLTTLGLVITDVAAADERGWQVAICSTGPALERETAVAPRAPGRRRPRHSAFAVPPAAAELGPCGARVLLTCARPVAVVAADTLTKIKSID